MNAKILLLTLFFASATLLAKARSVEANSNPFRKSDVNGSVIHSETKKPLSNVSVTAYSAIRKEKVVTTDNNGNFSFTDLKPGTYRVVFEKTGYRKITKDKVVILPDETYQINIEMLEADDFNFVPGTLNFVDF